MTPNELRSKIEARARLAEHVLESPGSAERPAAQRFTREGEMVALALAVRAQCKSARRRLDRHGVEHWCYWPSGERWSYADNRCPDYSSLVSEFR